MTLHRGLHPGYGIGIRYWDTGETLYDIEQAHYQTESASEGLSPTPHAFDWTMKTDTGFEIFCVVSHQPLQPSQMQALKHWMHVFSYQGAQIKKYKPKAMLELQNRDALEAKFLNFDDRTLPKPIQFQKAKFDELILTGREQAYIQHLILQRPYKDIAAIYQVSEAAVHKAVFNIKHKLGCGTMNLTEMFDKLNHCGALSACMQSI
jgi:DNA-binding CsgD family transcriptional regulator